MYASRRQAYNTAVHIGRYGNIEYQPPTGTVIDFRINFSPVSPNPTYQVTIRRYQGDQINVQLPPNAFNQMESDIIQCYKTCGPNQNAFNQLSSVHKRTIILFFVVFIILLAAILTVIITGSPIGVIVAFGIGIPFGCIVWKSISQWIIMKYTIANSFLTKSAQDLLPKWKQQYPTLEFSTIGPISKRRGKSHFELYDFIRVSIGPPNIIPPEQIKATTSTGISTGIPTGIQQQPQVQQIQQIQQVQGYAPMQVSAVQQQPVQQPIMQQVPQQPVQQQMMMVDPQTGQLVPIPQGTLIMQMPQQPQPQQGQYIQQVQQVQPVMGGQQLHTVPVSTNTPSNEPNPMYTSQ